MQFWDTEICILFQVLLKVFSSLLAVKWTVAPPKP